MKNSTSVILLAVDFIFKTYSLYVGNEDGEFAAKVERVKAALDAILETEPQTRKQPRISHQAYEVVEWYLCFFKSKF